MSGILSRKIVSNNPVDIFKKNEDVQYTIGTDVTNNLYKISGTALGTNDKMILDQDGKMTIGGSEFKFATSASSVVDSSIIVSDVTGTDVSGKKLILKSGKSTGSANGGAIEFHTSKGGSAGDTANTHTAALTIAGNGDITAANNVTVTGNFTVNGTTTTVNVDTVTIKDPVIELGTSYTTDTTIDRGMKFIYGPSKIGFMGYDNSAGKFIFLNDATESSNVFTPVGTNNSILLGNLNGYILDDNKNEILKYNGVASAVNEVSLTNAATGTNPILSATGENTDISLIIQPKGTGTIKVGTTSAAGILESNGDNDLILQTGNAATGNITITDGANGNISLNTNGTGKIIVNSTVQSTSYSTGALVISGGVGIAKDCYIQGTIYASESTTLSDKRYKENIQTIDSALSKVNSLRGVYFDWIDKEKFNDRKQIGFIAQEVEAVCPELVVETDNHKTVNYAQSVGLLVEAIKEQQIMIQSLKEELELLKTKL